MRKKPVYRTSEEKKRLVKKYKSLTLSGAGKKFLEQQGIRSTQMSQWMRGKSLGYGPGAKKKVKDSGSFVQAVKYFEPSAKDGEEIERLRMENTALRAVLTIAMANGFADFLTLENPSAKR